MADRSSFQEALVREAAAIGRPLEPEQAEALASHRNLLATWSARMNLTGLRSDRDILARHFLEPIAAADLLGDSGTLLDLGSGNGFPAIPLKVLHPGLRLILVESSEKKSAFLWAVLRELRLKDARVVTRRIQDLADLDDLLPAAYLTLRAVRAGDLLKGRAAGPLLEPGGRALFFVTAAEAARLRRDPPPGLLFEATRPLPSGPASVVAVFKPASS